LMYLVRNRMTAVNFQVDVRPIQDVFEQNYLYSAVPRKDDKADREISYRGKITFFRSHRVCNFTSQPQKKKIRIAF
jgi:hypothetical protein